MYLRFVTMAWLLSPFISVIHIAAQEPTHRPSFEKNVGRPAESESLATKRELKRRIREVVAAADTRAVKAEYGLKFDEGALASEKTKPLVVAIHGYNSYPAHLQSILRIPRKLDLDCGVFMYPNDHEAAYSAKLLSRELKQLRRDHPRRAVQLVAFSLGSVIAREAIENSDLDPGNVRQLIMISPPNQGSALANFAYGMDLWEYLGSDRRRELGFLFAAVEDGLAEAAVDLRPHSLFLKKLNSRSRNPLVQYSIFLGNQGYVSQEEVAKLKESLQVGEDYPSWLQSAARWFAGRVDGFDEVVHGKGDGVVSLVRGQLAGVDDVTIMPYTHTKAFDERIEGSRRLMQAVARKLSSANVVDHAR